MLGQTPYPTDAMVVGLHPLVDRVGALVDHLRRLELVLQSLRAEEDDGILVTELRHHLHTTDKYFEESRKESKSTNNSLLVSLIHCIRDLQSPPQKWCEQRGRSL